jgi:D-alanyl-D-alanine endopeptidase (penicillin-binding protein 7)
MKKLLLAITMSMLLIGNAQAHEHRHHKHRIRIIVVPAFSAKSYLVANMDGQILKEKDGEAVRPIASISKLMVAYLASDQDLTESLDIPLYRSVHSSIPYRVSSLTRKELLTLALVKSDNFAAQILCKNLDNCVQRMNETAQELGMVDTHYVEPTGLSRENVSTAHDLLKLLIAASTHPVITELSRMPKAEILTGKHIIRINNTNPLTWTLNIILSKTGFTNPAGGCISMIVDAPVGQRVIILLGSKNSHTRIPDMKKLVAEL